MASGRRLPDHADETMTHETLTSLNGAEVLDRAKKFFQVTAKGMREVQDSQRMLTSLWRNLAVLKGELA